MVNGDAERLLDLVCRRFVYCLVDELAVLIDCAAKEGARLARDELGDCEDVISEYPIIENLSTYRCSSA